MSKVTVSAVTARSKIPNDERCGGCDGMGYKRAKSPYGNYFLESCVHCAGTGRRTTNEGTQ